MRWSYNNTHESFTADSLPDVVRRSGFLSCGWVREFGNTVEFQEASRKVKYVSHQLGVPAKSIKIAKGATQRGGDKAMINLYLIKLKTTEQNPKLWCRCTNLQRSIYYYLRREQQILIPYTGWIIFKQNIGKVTGTNIKAVLLD